MSPTDTARPSAPVPGVFESFHPSVALVCCSLAIVLAMFVPQPVYAVLSLGGALALSGLVRGWRKTVAGLRWQAGAVLLLSFVNGLVAGYGQTVLWSWGPLRFTAESLAYGATMAGMLVAVLVWCEDMAAVVDSDALMELFGRRAPALATMLAIAAQLVPQIARRWQTVRQARLSCTAGRKPSAVRERIDLLAGGMLLSWTLEDSLERADAMRARGWGVRGTRTAWQSRRFRPRDGAAILGLVALAALSGILAGIALDQWQFYPTLSRPVFWWGYLPYAALAMLPAASCLYSRLLWKEGA